jgi:fructokinase
MNARPLVVGIGEILWDLLPTGTELGGAPANFAFHASALGAEGVIVSAVGDDEPGREILAALERRKLDRSYVATVDAVPTGAVGVSLDAEGVPRYVIHQGVAWDFIPWTPSLRDLARRADAVCYGTLAQRSAATRETIRAFLDATGPACLRVLDLNLRPPAPGRDLIHGLLERSSVLKLNDDELRALAGLFGIEGAETEILARLLELYPLSLIALTKGPGGSRLFGRGRESVHNGYPVAAADTVGAGDAFTAALVVGLLAKKRWDLISDRANRIASYVCTRRGAWPEIPADLAAEARE